MLRPSQYGYTNSVYPRYYRVYITLLCVLEKTNYNRVVAMDPVQSPNI